MSRSCSYRLAVVLILSVVGSARAQTAVRLSTIIPGSENVQLVYNGDFQFQGPLTGGDYPYPNGWFRSGDMFARSGRNMVSADNNVVARGHIDGGAPVGLYQRTISLQPNTAYVLSAYLWNMGEAVNHVSTVVDMQDAFNEPQLTLYYSDCTPDQRQSLSNKG